MSPGNLLIFGCCPERFIFLLLFWINFLSMSSMKQLTIHVSDNTTFRHSDIPFNNLQEGKWAEGIGWVGRWEGKPGIWRSKEAEWINVEESNIIADVHLSNQYSKI